MRVQSCDGVTIRNTRFLRNKARGSWWDKVNANGGGLHFEKSQVLLQTCTLTENAAVNQGGGIWGDISSRSFRMESSVVNANAAGVSGAGVYVARLKSEALRTITQITSTCLTDNQVYCLILLYLALRNILPL